MLAPVRESFRTGKPLEWTRVTDLPDFVYFDHSIHVAKGIGCQSCHGRVDQMPLMRKAHAMHMEWCLDCHRHPEVNVRRKTEVFQFLERQEQAQLQDIGRTLVDQHGIKTQQLDELLDMSPLASGPNDPPLDLAALRAAWRVRRANPTGGAWRKRRKPPGFRNCSPASSPQPCPSRTIWPAAATSSSSWPPASLWLASPVARARRRKRSSPTCARRKSSCRASPSIMPRPSRLGGYALGVLAESHMGRPTKIEGNPEHPASLGATDAFAQASVLGLYDPDRSQTVMYRGRISTWDKFLTAISTQMEGLRDRGGQGLSILTETITSPTLAAQIRALREEMPELKWQQYEPFGRHSARTGCFAGLRPSRGHDLSLRACRRDLLPRQRFP